MAAEYKSRVGGRIRQAREAKGWTQSRLARELPESIDGPSVSRWENAKVAPGPDYLEALARALDVDLAFFLTPTPEPGSPDLLGALGGEAEPTDQLDRIEETLRRNESMLAEILARLSPGPGADAEELGDHLTADENEDPPASASAAA